MIKTKLPILNQHPFELNTLASYVHMVMNQALIRSLLLNVTFSGAFLSHTSSMFLPEISLQCLYIAWRWGLLLVDSILITSSSSMGFLLSASFMALESVIASDFAISSLTFDPSYLQALTSATKSCSKYKRKDIFRCLNYMHIIYNWEMLTNNKRYL